MEQDTLIAALQDPAAYPHDTARVELIETHISYVLLTGALVYKIKKAIRFDFVDFSTLALRRFYCEEELRLNRRYAPGLYLRLVPVVRRAGQVRMDGEGATLDYAVQMRQFPQTALLSALLARGELDGDVLERLAVGVARFHAIAAVAKPTDSFGRPAQIAGLMRDNFEVLERLLADPAERATLARIRDWTLGEERALEPLFEQRRKQGFVRECHGDLHLRNVAMIDGEPTMFDCIDFNANLRWIDVANEIAFTVMDLQAAGRDDLANRFLNAYLEQTGDHGSVRLLRYYVCYRALVRAKVAALRQAQSGQPDQRAQVGDYLRLAQRCSGAPTPALIIMHGLSGSGKSAVSRRLAELAGAVRLRSDVERKRLHGLSADSRSHSPLGGGLYQEGASGRTYEHLRRTAAAIIDAGFPVIVDATFLHGAQRDSFAHWAADAGIAFAIVDLQAPPEVLRQRVRQRMEQRTEQRSGDASEADLSVLERQFALAEPLQPREQASVFVYDATRPLQDAARRETWQALLDRLGLASDANPARAQRDRAA